MIFLGLMDKIVEPNSYNEAKDQHVWNDAMKEKIKALKKMKDEHL
jgi:hypothetical protein